MLIEPVKAYVHTEFRVKFAIGRWERDQAFHLRRMVFCVEQGLFDRDGPNADRDALDERAILIVAFACVAGMPEQIAGTVRIDEREPRIWYGSRLAIHPAFRGHAGLAAALIRLSVCTANARGCERFMAYVQAQNARLFRRLHWSTLAEEVVHGRPHHRMQADLAFYPPFADGANGFVTRGR